MTNLLLLGIRTYLSKVNNGQEDITIENFISRRSTHDEWTSGGSRTIMFPCRTVISPETSFMEAAYEIQNVQNRIYMHSNYDPAKIREEMKRRYNTPDDTTYESCYLTYQPMPVKMDNPFLKDIPMHTKWFANGADSLFFVTDIYHPGISVSIEMCKIHFPIPLSALSKPAVRESAYGTVQTQAALSERSQILCRDLVVCHDVREHEVKDRPLRVHHAARKYHDRDRRVTL